MEQRNNQYEEAYRVYKITEQLKKRQASLVQLRLSMTKPWKISQYTQPSNTFNIVDEDGVIVAEAHSREIANLIVDSHNVNILLGIKAEDLHNEPNN